MLRRIGYCAIVANQDRRSNASSTHLHPFNFAEKRNQRHGGALDGVQRAHGARASEQESFTARQSDPSELTGELVVGDALPSGAADEPHEPQQKRLTRLGPCAGSEPCAGRGQHAG